MTSLVRSLPHSGETSFMLYLFSMTIKLSCLIFSSHHQAEDWWQPRWQDVLLYVGSACNWKHSSCFLYKVTTRCLLSHFFCCSDTTSLACCCQQGSLNLNSISECRRASGIDQRLWPSNVWREGRECKLKVTTNNPHLAIYGLQVGTHSEP